MQALQYTFLEFYDIIEITWSIRDQNEIGFVFLFLSTILIISLFFLIVPIIFIKLEKSAIRKEKEKKKNLLTEILLKKEIEDEIEKEISIEKNAS